MGKDPILLFIWLYLNWRNETQNDNINFDDAEVFQTFTL